MRIDKMTKDQTARFGEWSKKWIEIGLSTEPADFDAATEAALRAYKLCNLNRPMVVLRMGSPYGATLGGALAWAMLRAAGNPKVRSQVGSQVESQVEETEALLEHLRGHDTHEAIQIPAGSYELRRQREHTPEGWRRVAD